MNVKKKIIIIDDDADIVEAIKVVLESSGYSVDSADNIKDGLKKTIKIMPDLIIMDVMMEKMCDGFDLARELKSVDKLKDIPIIMITAIKDKTGFDLSDSAGDREWLPVDLYIEKPVDFDFLLRKVGEILLK